MELTHDQSISEPSRISPILLLLLPGALIVYLGFNAGGFFANTPAFAAIVLLVALILRVALANAPFEGLGWPLALAGGALALYALWVLVSGWWSDAHGRALLEFDRVLLYLLALVLFGSIRGRASHLRWILRGVALGIALVCLAGLVTRVLPEAWPITPNLVNNRLSYPVTYWNALGLLSAIGVILCFHLASSRSEPPVLRVLGSAAVPALATTLLFTFSRGAIVAGIISLLAYIVVARPRGLVSGLLAAGPATAIALVVAYDADKLATEDPTTPAAIAQGHHVAIVIGSCIVAAALLRWLLLWLDEQLGSVQLPPRLRRPLLGSAALLSVAAVIVASFALDAPGYVGRQYDRFVHVSGQGGKGGDVRTRLIDPANNGRLGEWDVALDGFGDAAVKGNGAGTYQLLWEKERPVSLANLNVVDAHSLYVEVLGELGIVGLILLTIAVGSILTALAVRTRGPNRALYGALFAATIAWTLHSGVDWDWEMPVVTLWVFAVGGAVLARPGRRDRLASRSPSLLLRGAIVAGLLALSIPPTLILISQSRLTDGVNAFKRGDCTEAVSSARSSISALGVRPEPYQILGYCYARRGSTRLAVQNMQKAIKRDPNNWEFRYGLALARAAAGMDPRPAARAALELNPLDELTTDAVKRFRSEDPQAWKRRVRTAGLPHEPPFRFAAIGRQTESAGVASASR